MSQASLIQLIDVTKHYPDGNVMALADVTLSIDRGDHVAIVGPSGCGKSTLLNLIGALDRPTSGEVSFDGIRLDKSADLDQIRSKEIGFVFQSFHLLPNLTALENVQLPMMVGDLGPASREQRAAELLEQVGLADRKLHLPGKLSNGQRQRVAMARALANQPQLILADEPTGALDSESGQRVLDLLVQLCQEQSTTLVIVTHDARIADRSERVVRLSDGRVIQDDVATQ